MIGIVSVSHYFQPVAYGAALPSLEVDMKTLCREPFRRIDRFIQLALLGSAHCVDSRRLQADCGIYLGSGLGPLSNNIAVQEQLIRGRELPMPFNFVNTLGSSAGFYVARNLGLSGRNFFISRRGASFEAVLSAALADFTLGAVTQALVGVVEEATLPLEAHRRRQRLPDNAVPAEGSHWWLLQADVRGPSLELHRFEEFSGLFHYLQAAWTDNAHLLCAHHLENGQAAELHARFPGIWTAGMDGAFHDSLDGAQVVEFCTLKPSRDLFLASGSECGWTLFHFRP